jgi:hypothetical protein
MPAVQASMHVIVRIGSFFFLFCFVVVPKGKKKKKKEKKKEKTRKIASLQDCMGESGEQK